MMLCIMYPTNNSCSGTTNRINYLIIPDFSLLCEKRMPFDVVVTRYAGHQSVTPRQWDRTIWLLSKPVTGWSGGGGWGGSGGGLGRSLGYYTDRHPQYRFLLCYRVLYCLCMVVSLNVDASCAVGYGPRRRAQHGPLTSQFNVHLCSRRLYSLLSGVTW